MSDVFKDAGTRKSRSSHARFVALDAYPQFTDTDGGQTWTRALVARESDLAMFAAYAKGATMESLADALTEQARLRADRKSATDALADIPAAADIIAAIKAHADCGAFDTETVDTVDALALTVAETDAALDMLPDGLGKDPAYHVSRTLAEYLGETDTDTETVETDTVETDA